jgi:hypothetical protein
LGLVPRRARELADGLQGGGRGRECGDGIRWTGRRGLDSGNRCRGLDDGGNRHGLDDMSVLRGSRTKTGGRVGSWRCL